MVEHEHEEEVGSDMEELGKEKKLLNIKGLEREK